MAYKIFQKLQDVPRITSIDQAVLTNDQKNSILASISEALQTHKETILQPIKKTWMKQ